MRYTFIIEHNNTKVVIITVEDFKNLMNNEPLLKEMIEDNFNMFWSSNYDSIEDYIAEEWEGLLVGNDGLGYFIEDEFWD